MTPRIHSPLLIYRWSFLSAVLFLGISLFSIPAVAQKICLATEIHGYVTAGNKRLQGIEVRVEAMTQGSDEQAMTDSSGSFRFMGVVPGVYKITAKGPGYKDAETNVDIRTTCSAFTSLSLQPLSDASVEHDAASSATHQEVDASAAAVPHEDLE